MRYLLDTDHISILQRQIGSEFAKLVARIGSLDPVDLAFPIVSFHEQVLGCHTYICRAHSSSAIVRGYGMLARVLRDFSAAPVQPFDAAVAATLDELASRRLRMGTMDLRIAAIPVSRGLVLVTSNTSDFGKVTELQTENWTV